MRKKAGIIKRNFATFLIIAMSINSFGAIVSDNDGSAFITKSEFDALKSSFQSQIDTYNQSIDSKIDGAIASYLAGIKLTQTETVTTIFDLLDDCPTDNYKRIDIIGKNNEQWFQRGWVTGMVGTWNLMPPVECSVTHNLSFLSPYWKALNGSDLSNSMPRIDGFFECYFRFQRANASLYNISMWGQGNAIDEFQYGLRGIQQDIYTQSYTITTTAGPNWLALTPKNRKFRIKWSGSNQGLISNANEESSVPYNQEADSIGKKSGANLICLRWGNKDENKTPLTLTEPLMGRDGTYTDRAATDSLDGWTQWTGSNWAESNWLKSTVNTNYIWWVVNGTPATSYRNSKVYFFPGADDHNTLYKYDQTNIPGNYVKRTIDVDTPSVWTGTTNDDGNGYKVTNFKSEYYPSYESQVLLKSVGAITEREECPVRIPVELYGDPMEFNEANMTKITDCYWSRLTPVSGTKQIIGDCPILFGGLQKNGTVTIRGFNLDFYKNGNTEWQGRTGTKAMSFGISKNGRNDEVLNTGTNKYEIKNCIPFKYRTYGSSTWIDATGPITITPNSTTVYEIQIAAEKNTDYYIHYIDPVGAANGYDEQHLIFRGDMTKYEAGVEYSD